jgi:hypothetical protein
MYAAHRRRSRRKLVAARVIVNHATFSVTHNAKSPAAHAPSVLSHSVRNPAAKAAFANVCARKPVAKPRSTKLGASSHHLDAKLATVRFVSELVKNVPPPPALPLRVKMRAMFRRIFLRGSAPNLVVAR